MSEINKAMMLVNLLKHRVHRATAELTEARCKLAANEAASRVWEENNRDDGVGGMSCNPYGRSEFLEKTLQSAETQLTVEEGLYDFVVAHFVDECKVEVANE